MKIIKKILRAIILITVFIFLIPVVLGFAFIDWVFKEEGGGSGWVN